MIEKQSINERHGFVLHIMNLRVSIYAFCVFPGWLLPLTREHRSALELPLAFG
jgi:hypothetical protein